MTEPATPPVSVVVPTYDRPDCLRTAVDSVARQTYDAIELVVVDDASPTPAREVLEAVPTGELSVTVVRHEENQGGSAARNTGIRASEGEYIAFLDDDDLWFPEKVERQVAAFRDADDDVGVVYTDVARYAPDESGALHSIEYFQNHPERLDTGDTGPHVSGDVTKTLLCQEVIGSFSVLMVRADVAEAAGPVDERFPSLQDWEWYVRLSLHAAFEPVPEPLVVRRKEMPFEQITDDFETLRNVSYPLFVEKYADVAADYGPLFERKMRGWVTYHLAWLALGALEFSLARQYVLRAILYYPFAPKFYATLVLAVGGGPFRTLYQWLPLGAKRRLRGWLVTP